uniref:Solute carrier family 46 member 3 n=1 Tax=Plectus sambesii TaxID=2011161 RepID=A0A914VU89_9BILA
MIPIISGFLSYIKRFNVEPVLLLFTIQAGIVQTTMGPFLYWRRCVELFNTEVPDVNQFCHELAMHNGTNSQEQVESFVVTFSNVLMLCAAIPALIVSPLYGAWSDGSGGRKAPLLIALTGVAIYIFTFVLCTFRYEIPMYYILIGTTISSLSGGSMVVTASCFSIITDEAHEAKKAGETGDAKQMGARIGIASAVFFVGTVLGSLLTTVLKLTPMPYKSYTFSILMAEFMLVLAFLFTMMRVKDVDGGDDTPASAQAELQSSGSTPHPSRNILRLIGDKFAEAGTVMFKRRIGYRRLFLLLGLVLYLLLLTALGLITGVILMFVKRKPLDWSDSRFGLFMAYANAVGAAGMVLAPKLLSKVKIFGDGANETFVIILGLIFCIVEAAILSISDQTWMVFFGSGFGFFGRLVYPAFRTFFAKLVQPEETGRLFSAVSIVENITPVIGAPLFSFLFALTFEIWTGAIFAFAACIYTIALVGMFFIHVGVLKTEGETSQSSLMTAEVQSDITSTNAPI